jgi:alpha-tubulin suppressor-like RCC1 family protein
VWAKVFRLFHVISREKGFFRFYLFDLFPVFCVGSEGQLGHRDYTDRFEPLVILSLITNTIVEIACGAEHSIVRTELGDIYSFGSNAFGQVMFELIRLY